MDPMPPDALLAAFPEPIAAIGRDLRAAVLSAAPGATERMRPGWRLVGFDLPVGRRTAYFAWVAPERAHIHLGFPQGVLMADPAGRMAGAGITRRARWLTFRPGDVVDPDDLTPLIGEAARVARLSRGERVAAAMAAGPGGW